MNKQFLAIARRATILTGLVMLVGSVAVAQTEQWQALGVKGKDVDVQGNTVWVVGTDDVLRFWNGTSWQQHASPMQLMTHVSVGPDQRPVIVGPKNWSAVFKSTGSGWSELPGGGGSPTISVDSQNRPWSRYYDYFRYHDGQKWNSYKGWRGQVLEMNAAGMFATIGNGGLPYRIVNERWQEIGKQSGLPAGRGSDIAIDGRGHVWVTVSGRLARHDGSRWVVHQPPQGAARVSVTEAGQPYIIGNDGLLYTCSGCTGQIAQPQQQNRAPYAPVILSPTTNSTDGNRWDAIAANPQAGIYLRWRNSGDPDRDPVSFWMLIYRWDGSRWVTTHSGYAPEGGPPGEGAFLMTSQHGLVVPGYYVWYVAAVDRRDSKLYTFSQAGRFRTGF